MTKKAVENSNSFIYRTLLCLVFIVPITFIKPVSAQQSRQEEVTDLVDSIKAFNSRHYVEKLYVQMDKPAYMSGDTIWFKVYLFGAKDFSASAQSGLLYVEIASDSNKVIRRMMLPVIAGLTWGNIALDAKAFPEGTYTLRAYTNWMRNFGEDNVFSKRFMVSSPDQRSWLVTSQITLSEQKDRDHIGVALQFHNLEKFAVGLREMKVTVADRNGVLYRGDKETTAEGGLAFGFNLPEKVDPKSIILIVEDLRKGQGNRKIGVPLTVSRPDETDLQFMPEGGYLVAGIPSEVGFKAIGEDGKGKDIAGRVFNGKMEPVVTFASTHKGMGVLSLLPEKNEKYLARIDLPDGTTKDYVLPQIQNSGTVLKVRNHKERDSLEVFVSCTSDMMSTNRFYYLIGQSNGGVYYGASIMLIKGVVKIMIAKDAFPQGIARLSLLNGCGHPLNERAVYIDHQDTLNIHLTPDKKGYSTRDRIALNIEVTDQNGKPVRGSFSLAVTDDGRVKNDTASPNIISHLLLTSDLKGTVETPGYYFSSKNPQKEWQDLDNLLLTQGWVGFKWEAVFDPKPLVYRAEPEFMVNGRVTNMFNAPVANSGVLLFSRKPLLVLDTVSDKLGRFSFKSFPALDSAIFLIQARNKKGRSFNVGIEVDEFIPPVFSASHERMMPWYINSDTTLVESAKRLAAEKEQWKRADGIMMLNEVTITAKKMIKDSKNLNGAGNADYVFDEKDMESARKLSLFELLEQRFKGFRKTGNPVDTVNYMLLNSIVNLIIDGVNVKDIGSTEDVYMDYLTADDIIGIEIMHSSKYALAYDPNIIAKKIGCRECPPPPVYLEITTRSGNGAFSKKTPAVYIYKPLPFSFPDEFYSPKYTVKDRTATADVRSTIHWEPNVMTDGKGKATVSFYSADLSGSYTVILEGGNMNGMIGSKRGTIMINGDLSAAQ